MTDKRSLAIILGTTVGIAAVAAAVSVYMARHQEPEERDVNDVFNQARQTVKKLDDAVEALRKSVA